MDTTKNLVCFAVSFAYFCLLQFWRKETTVLFQKKKEEGKLLEEKGIVDSDIYEFVVQADWKS